MALRGLGPLQTLTDSRRRKRPINPVVHSHPMPSDPGPPSLWGSGGSWSFLASTQAEGDGVQLRVLRLPGRSLSLYGQPLRQRGLDQLVPLLSALCLGLGTHRNGGSTSRCQEGPRGCHSSLRSSGLSGFRTCSNFMQMTALAGPTGA